VVYPIIGYIQYNFKGDRNDCGSGEGSGVGGVGWYRDVAGDGWPDRQVSDPE